MIVTSHLFEIRLLFFIFILFKSYFDGSDLKRQTVENSNVPMGLFFSRMSLSFELLPMLDSRCYSFSPLN